MATFFTGDEHFFNKNIIYYCKRPFSGPGEMTSQLITRHNKLVKPTDRVWHLGDLTFADERFKRKIQWIVEQLNGRHDLILGNHDYLSPFEYIDVGFTSVHTSMELTIDGIDIVLHHDPAAATIDKSKVWLVGHVHDLFKKIGHVINVGVDVWDWHPVSWEEIRELIMEETR